MIGEEGGLSMSDVFDECAGASFGLVWFFGEPCFQGWPIRYFTNPYAFTLPLQGKVPRPFISISSPPEGDSIQALPAVSFWKRERYQLSYRGRANRSFFILTNNALLLTVPQPQVTLGEGNRTS